MEGLGNYALDDTFLEWRVSMALLSAEEKAKLAKEGIYVKEKCDKCGKPILTPESYIKKIQGKTEVWCSQCAKGRNLSMMQIQTEENEMKLKREKKAAPKKETSKIAGHLVEGTAIADLYTLLEDERVHKLSEAHKALKKHKANPTGRIYQLGRYGKRFGLWGLIVTEDTIQLKKGKQAAIASSKKKEKAEKAGKKKVTTKKGQEPEEKGAAPSKALKATAALIRRVLKAGSDWTKNKLIQELKEEYGQDPKRVEAALVAEINNGGIEVEDGVLVLV